MIIVFVEITFSCKIRFSKRISKIKENTKYTIHEDVKKLKYVKTIKKYKILPQIHLNYKFKNITFKNI